jgi:hypothetical protein
MYDVLNSYFVHTSLVGTYEDTVIYVELRAGLERSQECGLFFECLEGSMLIVRSIQQDKQAEYKRTYSELR